MKYKVEILFDAGGDAEALGIAHQIENAAYGLDGVDGVVRGDVDQLKATWSFARTVIHVGEKMPVSVPS